MATTAATLDGGTTAIPEEAIETLHTESRATHLGAQARPAFNAMHAGVPAVTAVCAGTADVIDAVRFARNRDLEVAVRGGGHSLAGLSTTDGGMLIDLSPMRGVTVDPQRRRAVVQGGALWGDVDRECQAFGLGVAGRRGLRHRRRRPDPRRRLRLAAPRATASPATASSRRRSCSPTARSRARTRRTNPDLFWALRGGGGNFGVVTSLEFALQRVGPLVAFAGLFYPLEEIRADHARAGATFVEQAPDEITSTCVTVTFPAAPDMPEAIHDRPCVIVGGVHAGDPVEGMRLLQPLRELATPLADISQPTPFTAVQSGFDPLFPRETLRAYWKSQYLEALTDEAIEIMASRALDRPAPLTLVNMFHMGGAIEEIGPEETAFAERSAPYMVSIDGMWTDPADDADNVAWVRNAWKAFEPVGTGGVYLNFTGLSDELPDAGVESALGRNLRRLGEVKREYDPDNFFRLNNNIAPAS